MLQRIAGCALKAGKILISLALGDDVLAEEAIVGEAAAQVVTAPGGFSLCPWLCGSAKLQAV
jgi:hypothetical protein